MRLMVGRWCDTRTAPTIRGPATMRAYRLGMVRSGHCARPGCGEPAAATLTYDYGERLVWLHAPRDVDGSSVALCAAHADGLKVPVGWRCEDRRVTARSMSVEPLAC